MFKTLDGREHFYQWDSNVKLIVEDAAITEVHFCNRTDECSLICETYKENGLTLVNVPNVLLQSAWKIHCYAFGDDKTKYEKCFEVKARTKPADYVYTETEIKSWERLEENINTTLSNIEQDLADTQKQLISNTEEAIANTGFYTPVIDDNCNLSWVASKDSLPEAKSVNIKGEKGDKGDAGEISLAMGNLCFANALKGNASGAVISLDDVSNLEHILEVKASSKNIVKPPFDVSGTNTSNGVTYTINEDYSITASGKPTAPTSFRLLLGIDASSYRGKTANIIPRAETTYSYLYVHLWYVDGTVTYNWMRSTKETTKLIPDNASHFEIGIAYLADYSGEETTIYPFIQIGETATEEDYVPYVDVMETKVMTTGKNLIPYPYGGDLEGKTELKTNGITAKVDGYKISLSGSPTTAFTLMFATGLKLQKGTYSLSGIHTISSDNVGGVDNVTLVVRDLTLKLTLFQKDVTAGTCNFEINEDYSDVAVYLLFLITSVGRTFNGVIRPQLEIGTATEYEPYKGAEYFADEDGTVSGVQSVSSKMALISERDDVVLDVQYNKDINKTIETLTQAIISLGGNI